MILIIIDCNTSSLISFLLIFFTTSSLCHVLPAQPGNTMFRPSNSIIRSNADNESMNIEIMLICGLKYSAEEFYEIIDFHLWDRQISLERTRNGILPIKLLSYDFRQ